MLIIYLKAIISGCRQILGDLWGVLWRPRYTLQAIYERGTWGAWGMSWVLLLLAGYLGMPGMVKCIRVSIGQPHNHQLMIGTFFYSFDAYLFLFGFFITLWLSIRSVTKTGQGRSFLQLAGYCILPSFVLAIGVIGVQSWVDRLYVDDSAKGIAFFSFMAPLFLVAIFLTVRLTNIMLTIVCPAMTNGRRLVSIIAAFLGGNIVLNLCINVYRMIRYFHGTF